MIFFIFAYFLVLFSSLIYSNGDKYTVTDTRYSINKKSVLSVDMHRLVSFLLEEDKQRFGKNIPINSEDFYDKVKINTMLEEKRFKVLDLITDKIVEEGSLSNSAERLFIDFYEKGLFGEFKNDFDSVNVLMIINPTALSEVKDLAGKESLEWLESNIGSEVVQDSGIIFVMSDNKNLKFIPISKKLRDF